MFNSKMHYKQIKIGNILTSEIEIRDLIKAWVAISIVFSIFFYRIIPISFYTLFIISSLTVGTAFLFHELAHKLVAQRYGCFAEFRASNSMLIMALLIVIILPFVFAAPGAVMISGPVGRRRNGKISLAGPATNLILAFLFFILLSLNPTGLIKILVVIGFFVNSLLAMFNMLPFGIFDGRKVIAWNKTIFYVMFIISIIFFLISQQYYFSLINSL